MKVSEAYKKWKESALTINGQCCFKQHYLTGKDGDESLPDMMVCERERAWRQYVRLRDNDLTWMPDLRFKETTAKYQKKTVPFSYVVRKRAMNAASV